MEQEYREAAMCGLSALRPQWYVSPGPGMRRYRSRSMRPWKMRAFWSGLGIMAISAPFSVRAAQLDPSHGADVLRVIALAIAAVGIAVVLWSALAPHSDDEE